MSQVVIVGTGFVGATAAYSILCRGAAQSVILADADPRRAEGEAMDLLHAMPFLKTARVRAVPLEEVREADLVIVCAGRNSVPGETRLDLLKDNAERIRAICKTLKSWKKLPVVLVISNPVDVLAEIAWREMGRPQGGVFGSGTALDTARLKALLGEHFDLDPHSLHGYVLGEHGDSEFVAWSTVTAGGVGIRRWPGYVPAEMDALFEKVRTAAYEIIQRKRATYYAIGAVAALMTEAVLRNQRTILPVSVSLEGRYGIKDVSLSLPCVLGKRGVVRVLEPSLPDDELQALLRSAEVLRKSLSTC